MSTLNSEIRISVFIYIIFRFSLFYYLVSYDTLILLKILCRLIVTTIQKRGTNVGERDEIR